MNFLADLEKRSMRINGLAVSLGASIVASDVAQAERHLAQLREEIGLAEVSLAILKSVGRISDESRSHASVDILRLEAYGQLLAEKLIRVLVGLGDLKGTLREEEPGMHDTNKEGRP